MKSRNGTFVNNKEVTARTLLKDNDKIKICDNLLAFFENPPKAPLPEDMRPSAAETDVDECAVEVLDQAEDCSRFDLQNALRFGQGRMVLRVTNRGVFPRLGHGRSY